MKSTISKLLKFNVIYVFGLFITLPIISMDDLNKSSLLIFEFPAPELKAAQQKDFGLQESNQFDFTPADSDDAAASLLKKVQIPNLTVPNFSDYAVLGGLLSTKISDTKLDTNHEQAQDFHNFIEKYSLRIPEVGSCFAPSKTFAKETASKLIMLHNNALRPTIIVPSISLATIWSVAEKK